jgi:cytochrome c peroxidase
MRTNVLSLIVATALAITIVGMSRTRAQAPAAANAKGEVRTLSANGAIDRRNPFFRPLGKQFATTCEHCHFATDGWSVSAEHIRQLFNTTQGRHPIFTAPSANDFHAALALGGDASPGDRQSAYSLLLDKGDVLVRRNFDAVAADFAVLAVIDPSLPPSLHTIAVDQDGKIVPAGTAGSMRAIPGAAYLQYTAQDNAGAAQIWIHRRPLPTTNFKFLTTVAWDGQDTRQGSNPATRTVRDGVHDVSRATIRGRETGGSLVAVDGHAYTDAELTTLSNQMTEFMFSLTTAQESLGGALGLGAKGASGGVVNLSKQKFYFGINDTLQGDLTVSASGEVTANRAPFNPVVFTLYDAWHEDRDEAHAAIERGQALFNAQRLTIDRVGGLNGASITLPDGSTTTGPASAFRGSCSTCHNAPNVGDHSTRLPINIGVSEKTPVGFERERAANLPLFILRRKTDGAIAQTTDPGRAVISGRFAHIGQFKGPILRGVASHPPFFHNGIAATLDEVVEFYNTRFKADFTAHERSDLVAFLKAL